MRYAKQPSARSPTSAGSGSAADWTIIEFGTHPGATGSATRGSRKACAEEKLVSRERFVGARTRAEALRRVLEVRRSEDARGRELTEHKEMDEVASLLRVRR